MKQIPIEELERVIDDLETKIQKEQEYLTSVEDYSYGKCVMAEYAINRLRDLI